MDPGSAHRPTQLSSAELSVEPIRADALILLDSPELILHLEFQTAPDPDLPFRMVDYRIRIHRRFPNKEMRQVVLYLRQTGSVLVYETSFRLSSTVHEFEVIRLWEQPPEAFLSSEGLLPFAALAQSPDPLQTLRQVAQRIEEMEDRRKQSNVSAATAVLAGLALEKELIQSILRSEQMKESVIYQEWISEAKAEGI